MKWSVLILLSIVAMIVGAQSSTEDRRSAPQTQTHGYWVDPSTGLMWAGKDNGRDVSWNNAMKYCRDLRLAGTPTGGWRMSVNCKAFSIGAPNLPASPVPLARVGPSRFMSKVICS